MSDLKPGVEKVIREAVNKADDVWISGPHEQVLTFLDHVCTKWDAGPQVNELRDAVKEIYYG